MAERRMFAKKIVRTDWFMTMPQTAQNLYWHLNMDADDDGFISNTRQVMRSIGSTEDDLTILLTKRFLMPFENGLMLVKHWRIHNYIQSDRYTPTTHQEERESVRLKENGVYSLSEGERLNDVVSKLYTQVSIGKDRKGKDIKKRTKKEMEALQANFERFWSIYPRKVGKKTCWNIWNRANFTTEQTDTIIKAVDQYKGTDQWKRGFIPHPSTFLNQGRYEDEIEALPAPKPTTKSYG